MTAARWALVTGGSRGIGRAACHELAAQGWNIVLVHLRNEDAAAQTVNLTGITSGATFAGALQVAQGAPKGSTILAMLPDTGERYLSTPLFADVVAEMNAEEQAIYDSM